MSSIPPAHAQTKDNSEAAGAITEVVVTSSKLGSARVLEVPVSIQAMTGDMLERRAITDFKDYMATVPSLSAWDQGPGNKRYVLRGVNGGNGAGTVGLYLDEIIITGEDSRSASGGGQQPDTKLYDMERIEVIKGPQSTTFGSSSMSGVIRYITKKPELTEVDGYVKGGLTYQDYAGVGEVIEGALNLPVKTDVFGLRVAGQYTEQPGYIDSRQKSDVNNEETASGRIQALLRVNDRIDLSFMAMYQKTESDGASWFNSVDYYGNPLPARTQYPQEKLPWTDEAKLFNVTGVFDTGAGLITATASRNDRTLDVNRAASQVMARSAGLGTSFAAEQDGIRSILRQPKDRVLDSFELRFASEFAGPLQVLVGGFHSDDDRQWSSEIVTVNSSGDIDPASGVRYGPILQQRGTHDKVKESALFGQATWNITDRWALTAGLRAFEIETSNQSFIYYVPMGIPAAGVGPQFESKESSTSGRVNLAFKPNSNTLLYAEVGEGFRAGGTNDPSVAALSGVTIPDSFDADSLINYEVGYKVSLLNGSLSLTAAAFQIDWDDMQVSLRTQTTPAIVYIGNANESRVRGAEVEVQYVPFTGLTVGGSAGYTRSEILSAVAGGGVAGDDVPYSPRLTASLFADYRWPVGGNAEAFVGADISYRDKRYTDFPANVSTYRALDAYELVNIRGGVSRNDWTASLVVKNLLNDDSVIDQGNPNAPIALYGYFMNAPRQVSLFVTKTF